MMLVQSSVMGSRELRGLMRRELDIRTKTLSPAVVTRLTTMQRRAMTMVVMVVALVAVVLVVGADADMVVRVNPQLRRS